VTKPSASLVAWGIAMTNSIAVINAGSSSIKFALFDATKEERRRFRGQIGGIGTAPHLNVVDATGQSR